MPALFGPLAAVALVAAFTAYCAQSRRARRTVAAVSASTLAALFVVAPWPMASAGVLLVAAAVTVMLVVDRAESQLVASRQLVPALCESCRLRPATEKVALAAGVFTVCPACAVPVSRGWAA